MASRIEFYEQLRGYIPEPAARLIAEEMRPEGEIATTQGLREVEQRLDARITEVEQRLGDRIHGVEISVERLRSSMFRWNLVFFVPLWVGTYATLVAIVFRGAP